MTEYEIGSIVIQILVAGLVVYVAFFKSYMQEKGKNLATKEDIREITSTVEAVKHELRIGAEAKLSLREEERAALVDLYVKYHAWLSTITNAPVADFNENNRSQKPEIDSQLALAHFEFELALGRMELFNDSKELREAIFPLQRETIRLSGAVTLSLIELEMVFVEIDTMKAKTPSEHQVAAYGPLLKKRKAAFANFNQNKLEHLETIFPLKEEVRSKVLEEIRRVAGAT